MESLFIDRMYWLEGCTPAVTFSENICLVSMVSRQLPQFMVIACQSSWNHSCVFILDKLKSWYLDSRVFSLQQRFYQFFKGSKTDSTEFHLIPSGLALVEVLKLLNIQKQVRDTRGFSDQSLTLQALAVFSHEMYSKPPLSIPNKGRLYLREKLGTLELKGFLLGSKSSFWDSKGCSCLFWIEDLHEVWPSEVRWRGHCVEATDTINA